MDLTPHVEQLRRELATAAQAGGPDARELAERLTAPLESAVRLTLLEALASATAEITRDLAPGSVHVRLRGRDPEFVVSAPTAPPPADDAGPAAEPPFAPSPVVASVDDPAGAGADRGASSRINVRLPDDLRTRIEQAAARDRISVNAWLVRAAAV